MSKNAKTSSEKKDRLYKKRYTEKYTLDFYCDEWLKINRDRLKESTLVKYGTVIEKHINPRLKGYLISSLTQLIIEQFSHDLIYKEKLSPKTVKDILTVLHSVICYAGKNFPGHMQMLDIVYPKVRKSEMRVLSRDEQTLFTKYLLSNTDPCKFGVLLALLTGMRIGELCALKWENISINDKTIKIESTMQRLKDLSENGEKKTKIIIDKPKSDNSVRIIPLTEYTADLCKSQYCDNPQAFVLTGTNRYIEPRTMQYKLKQYTEKCGLKGVHFHTLRHTFATRCVEVDFEIKSLSEILGHSSPKITLERYIHSSIELKRDNMNKLAIIGY